MFIIIDEYECIFVFNYARFVPIYGYFKRVDWRTKIAVSEKSRVDHLYQILMHMHPAHVAYEVVVLVR